MLSCQKWVPKTNVNSIINDSKYPLTFTYEKDGAEAINLQSWLVTE